jgi:hypothetical protein
MQCHSRPMSETKKDYTLELPMIELGEVIKFITSIHEDALETATMTVVAEKLGYTGPTSTPFYRRTVAARLFKLLGPQGAGLTPQALDYLKPTTADAKNSALKNSILSIPLYNELIQTHQGKRLNPEIIANGIVRKITTLNNAGAAICAKVFIASLKFAEFLDADGTLKRLDAAPAIEQPHAPTPSSAAKMSFGLNPEDEFSEQEQNSFYLDKEKKKRVTLNCPLFLTRAEYDRICNWIKATWIIESEMKSE